MSNSMSLHENPDTLTPETIDQHRAIASIMEELEAVDWYAQRADATADTSLREILIHNRNEEMEHAAMAIEWLRRANPTFDAHLRTYLFTNGSITGIEAQDTGGDAAEANGDTGSSGSLGIADLREGGGR
jgi:uncharacterized protein